MRAIIGTVLRVAGAVLLIVFAAVMMTVLLTGNTFGGG